MCKSIRKWLAVCAVVTLLATLTGAAGLPTAAEEEILKSGDGCIPGGVNTDSALPFKNLPMPTIIRIPGAITLQNGDIYLTSDVRHEAWCEAGGIDIVNSVSHDGGKTWNYSFPIYFADSDDSGNPNACTAIDSLIVQGKDGTIYLFANVSPSGISCVTNPGFSDPGIGSGYELIKGKYRLMLTDDYSKTTWHTYLDEEDCPYHYYVGDLAANGYAPVLKVADHSATKWAVDDAWNIYEIRGGKYVPLTQEQYSGNEKNGKLVQQNLLFKDSVLHVFNTQYLWMATSKDNGKTWTHGSIGYLKQGLETEFRHGTGHGIVTADGTIIVPGYVCDYLASYGVMFIYSKDNGKTWHRTEQIVRTMSTDRASNFNECETVELADGTLRTFMRVGQNGSHKIIYVDAVWDAGKQDYVFSDPVNTGVTGNSDTKMTAIAYSKRIDGRQAILASYPTSTANRSDGKIFVFLVDPKTNDMRLAYTYSLPKHHDSPSYGYSNMTELKDGRVAILYEPTNNLEIVPIEAIAKGAAIGSAVKVTPTTINSVTTTTKAPTGTTGTTTGAPTGTAATSTTGTTQADPSATQTEGSATTTTQTDTGTTTTSQPTADDPEDSTTDAPTAPKGGLPWWGWVLIGVGGCGALAGGIFAFLRLRKK